MRWTANILSMSLGLLPAPHSATPVDPTTVLSADPAHVRPVPMLCGTPVVAELGLYCVTAPECPDIAVGYKGINHLFEIKDESKPPSQRKLTKDEKRFHSTWKGSVHIVESPEYAIRLIRGR